MGNKTIKYHKDHWIWALFLILLIGAIVLELALSLFSSFDKDQGIPILHAVVLLILTFVLAWIAWIQLSGLNKTSRADFLLRIDTRYCSSEGIKARTIIHKLYYKTKNDKKEEDKHIDKIGNEIMELRKSNADDFISLINFLDLLETIAFFIDQKYIEKEEMVELSGNSIAYYYKIYKPWIEHRRKRPNHEKDYKALQDLAEEIEKKP